jgi:hypothetical protein
MAITSLNNYSVQPAGANSNQGLLMPKLKYRFRVIFLNFGVETSTELTKQVVDVSRPKVSFEEMEIPVYNSKVYLAGKYTWETMSVNLRDDASGNVQKLVGQQIQKQFDFHEQAGARSGIDYKFEMLVQVLDGGNGAVDANVLETFHVMGCFLQNADYGDLNYGTNEAAQVALTIRFDNAIQYQGGEIGNIGNAVGIGRSVGEALIRQTDVSQGGTTTG